VGGALGSHARKRGGAEWRWGDVEVGWSGAGGILSVMACLRQSSGGSNFRVNENPETDPIKPPATTART
jgi:hypothetical protein